MPQQTQTTPPPTSSGAAAQQNLSSTLTTITNGNHHLHNQNNNNNGNTGNSTNLNECSNNFMNSVVHELNAIKLISNNNSASGVIGQNSHPTNSALNINCRTANTVDHSLLFGMQNGGGGLGVGDSNNSISILSSNNSSCNKPHSNTNNLWGQLPTANNNNNINNNTTQLLYNQTSATNISNLWGCAPSNATPSSTSTSSSSAVSNNNINNNQINGNINNNSNNQINSHPSLSPISSSSVRSSQYHSASSHRSNSKESLWTSSQSSPNSNLRESFYSIKSNDSPTSSNTSSAGSTCSSSNGGNMGGGGGGTSVSQNGNLWEGPLMGSSSSSKLTMDAATSYASQLNKISNIWEIPNPASNVANLCNPKPHNMQQQHQQQQHQQQHQQQQQRNGNCLNSSASQFLGQSRDLLFNDLWGNTDNCSATLNSSDHHQHQQQQHNQYAVGNVAGDSKLQSDTIGSIWRTTATPSIGNGAHHQQNVMVNRNKPSSSAATCGQMNKQNQQRPVIGANASFFTNATDPSNGNASSHLSSSASAAAAAAAASGTAPASSTAAGSSSCMQLFSEEFLNYLNMIN